MDYLQYKSIHEANARYRDSFKPYYKWITFNTCKNEKDWKNHDGVLNLIINGLPSIQEKYEVNENNELSFKPYYKWITFNTQCLWTWAAWC